jgi:ribose 5-phosphate isomerase B
MTADGPKTIVVGADHAGFGLKESIKAYLQSQGWQVTDVGCHSTDSVDYPDISSALAKHMTDTATPWGILCCGSGIGVSIGANRFAGIRAVTANDLFSATMSRRHNNANVLCLGARVVAEPMALVLLETFLATPFDGGPSHEGRVAKLG